MQKSIIPQALSPAQVEQFFGIPTGTLANLRWRREGPRFFRSLSRKVIYKTSDIQAWLFSSPVQTRDSIGRSGGHE